MSKEHRRPLVAFVLVLVASTLVLVQGVRSEALRGVLGIAPVVVVAGAHLVEAATGRDAEVPVPDARPRDDVAAEAAAPPVRRPQASRGDVRSEEARPASPAQAREPRPGPGAHAGLTTAPSGDDGRGPAGDHRHGPGRGERDEQRGKDRGRGHAHEKGHDGSAKGHAKGHGKGHGTGGGHDERGGRERSASGEPGRGHGHGERHDAQRPGTGSGTGNSRGDGEHARGHGAREGHRGGGDGEGRGRH